MILSFAALVSAIMILLLHVDLGHADNNNHHHHHHHHHTIGKKTLRHSAGPVEKFNMDQDYIENLKCDQGTFEVKKNQMMRQDYAVLIENIQSSSFVSTASKTLVVVTNEHFITSYKHICEESGGLMVSVDISYVSDVSEKRCGTTTSTASDFMNYSRYPICLAKTCKEAGSRHKTILGVLLQNLRISMECDPTIVVKEEGHTELMSIQLPGHNLPAPSAPAASYAPSESDCPSSLEPRMHYF